MDMVELLVEAPEINMALTNDHHLNPLQFAALLDRPTMVKLIGRLFPVFISIPTTHSGHSLLHIAAINGHVDVLKEILDVKDSSVHLDTKNDKSETALHLGTKSGKTESVEFLVSRGANVNSADNDGDTALHLLAMIKAKDASRVNHSPNLRKIQGRYKHNGCDDNASALMCFLVQHGASVDIQNHKCRTPLSYVSKYAKLKDTLKKISRGESDGMDKVSLWEDVEEKDPKYSRLKDNILDKDKEPVSVTAKLDIKDTLNPAHLRDLPHVHHINISELDMGPVIGKGQFGVVHRATWRGTSVAVKKISILGSKLSEVEKEVAIHGRASHPNIVQIMAHGYDGTYDAYIVMQLIEGLSLNDIIFSSNSVKRISLKRDQKVLISRAVLQAVTFLHGCNILHLDIKPANILIEDTTTRPYLCDLGLAHIKNRHAMSQSSFTIRGTPGYMPPEALGQLGSSRGHSDKHDVWSVAGTLVELFSEKRLWGDDINPFALIALLMTGTVEKPKSLEAVEHGVRIILDQCFNRDPGKRPAAKKLLDQFNTLK